MKKTSREALTNLLRGKILPAEYLQQFRHLLENINNSATDNEATRKLTSNLIAVHKALCNLTDIDDDSVWLRQQMSGNKRARKTFD